ncbi:hypothetical protein [Pseudomonas sp. TTU2014-080ASC]|uniref:hypothetical protein n=1 Tax=Pseudomonas sp. TTU2014-080ASC TaxID=1729724 RepID=UPI00071859C3|nr:hypothetical protein [Pseudomonas sp. TTU2014-080ASC]KRW60830.1 hypothetical protein AO726_05640 [Pseudomonas sp. TTU2014-080ASC]
MNPAITLPEVTPPQRWRGRLQLLLILAIVIAPMLVASAMYHGRFWIPETRNYHGVLIGNGQTLSDLGAETAENGRWQLLVTAPGACEQECKQLVYLARQINIGLNRDASRATHALAMSQALSADYEAQLQREYPQLGLYSLHSDDYQATAPDVTEPQLWIVDPMGNLVLRYGSQSKGKDVLDDLRHLLKISQIG